MGGRENIKTANEKSTSQKAARVMSRVLNPLYVALPASLAVCLKVSLNTGQAFQWWLIYITFSSLIPLVDLLVRLRLGKISDFHVTKREERTAPIVLNIFTISAGVILLRALGAPTEIVAMGVAGLFLVMITLVVNLWWKISLHALGMFEIYLILLLVFRSWHFFIYNLYMVVALLLVCWARIVLKKHTLYQVIAGSLVGALMPVIVFWSMGLLG